MTLETATECIRDLDMCIRHANEIDDQVLEYALIHVKSEMVKEQARLLRAKQESEAAE